MRAASFYRYFDPPFLALAHRGGYVEGQDASLENTIVRFQQAVDMGFRYLESDVHLTGDGTLIAFHDDTLDRVTDASGVVAQMPWSQVSQAKVGGREPIPTFDELLETFPEARFNIDIKDSRSITPLAEAIRRHHAEERMCVASFNYARLAAFKKQAGPHVATSLARPGVAWNALVPWVPRVLNFHGQALQVPVSSPVATRHIPILTRQLIASARARDMKVHVWTINDAEQMAHLIDMGVDGLISDRIDLLKQVCQARGLWSD